MPHDMPLDWNFLKDGGWLAAFAVVVSMALVFALMGSLKFEQLQPPFGWIVGAIAYVSCPLIAYMIFLFFCGSVHRWTDHQMSRDGQLTNTGVIREQVMRSLQRGENPADYPFLVIEFCDDTGKVHRVEREVDASTWERYRPNDRVPAIQYLKHDPATWRFAAEAGLGTRLLLRGGAVACLLVFLRATCALLVRWARKK